MVRQSPVSSRHLPFYQTMRGASFVLATPCTPSAISTTRNVLTKLLFRLGIVCQACSDMLRPLLSARRDAPNKYMLELSLHVGPYNGTHTCILNVLVRKDQESWE